MAGREYPLERARNVGVMTHIDASKTTLTERILYCIGVNCKTGNTHGGAATMDWMEQEQEKSTTVTSAAITCHWTLQESCKVKPGTLEHRTNIIGTPGHVDFTVEVERSLHVLDDTIGVFRTKDGVGPQSENVWRQADIYNVPRIAFISKMNILGTSFYGTVDQTRTRLGKNVTCPQLPIGAEDESKGIIDLFETKAYICSDEKGENINIVDIPGGTRDDAELYHAKLIGKICGLDDDLVMEYLEGEEPSVDKLKAALRRETCGRTVIPVCCGIAYRSRGVQKLLGAILEFMPAPINIPTIKGVDMGGNEAERYSSDDKLFFALVFKIMTDLFVRKPIFFRMYSDSVNSGSYALNTAKDKKGRAECILQVHANKRQELDRVYVGDIVAVVGFKITTTGDMIYDNQHPVILEFMKFPEPVIDIATEPKTKAGQGKTDEALAKLAEEDPTFRAKTNQETGQVITSGMGEFHLEIIADRLLHEFNVETNVDAPQVVYGGTSTKVADVDNKYARQSDRHGQYGYCRAYFEPMGANGKELFEFESAIIGDTIPKEYIPAVGAGIEEVSKAGILGGFSVLGVRATVYDGSYHEVDSNEMALKIAGPLAFREVMQKAEVILLELIMKIEVTMPEDYMGDVIGDINSRRGHTESISDLDGGKIVRAPVLLSEMFGYSTDLRSKTQGRGNYSMFFDRYEPVPKFVQGGVLAEKKGN